MRGKLFKMYALGGLELKIISLISIHITHVKAFSSFAQNFN
jgi:hypothetical protein